MISKSDLLLYYKRKDICEAMVEGAQDLEISTRYDFGFSKRPDILSYPDEILSAAKKGAGSFHFSEERWSNPMVLGPTLKKKDMEELRSGWDLVIDIDCPYWEFSKLSAKLILQALYDNGVEKSVSIKFSGNKGFHIGVPFESFPKIMPDGTPTERAFPDAARIVALYILEYIEENYLEVKNGNIEFDGKNYSLEYIKKAMGFTSSDEIIDIRCSNLTSDPKEGNYVKCGKPIKKINIRTVFVCPNCHASYNSENDFHMCDKCNLMTHKQEIKTEIKDSNKIHCSCGEDSKPTPYFRILSIIDVDTILISSRHLYRAVYSLHEKSGMVSAPFNPKKIDAFKKEFCTPEKVKISKFKFLDRKSAVQRECENLFIKAYTFNEKMQAKKIRIEESVYLNSKNDKKYDEEELAEEIPEELFPPCMKKGLIGLTDGKKRFMFALTNFLSMTGYEYERIEEILIDWNKKQPEEPLRDTILLGQVRYAKLHKKRILPPNCDNLMYYKDLGICNPDNFCSKIKNPVSYSKKKSWFLNNQTDNKENFEKVEGENASDVKKPKKLSKTKKSTLEVLPKSIE